jgi:starch-binding outer membrane protein, SusD/RagB family
VNKLKIKIILSLCVLLVVTNACNEDYLSVTPNGSLDAEVLANAKGVDALLIGTYSMLDGVASNGFGWEAASSNWVYGSIRALEANKGSDAGDASGINPIQTFTETANNPYLSVKWRSVYDGISRANSTLAVLKVAEENGTVTETETDLFRKQARTLRGFFHFEAWRMWSKADGSGIPYVDENTDLSAVTNFDDVRNQILADLEAGTTLPDNMTQIGRFNGTVAKVLYAKALMQMKKDFTAAKSILESVKTSGKKPNGAAIGLDPKYGDIFDAANRNSSPEAIYTIQYSVNDGSGGWNAGWGEVLNFPYKSGASPGGCCGFFQPTSDLVNSFRTSGGLPLLDESYNNQAIVDDQGLTSAQPFTEDTGPIDPRLDWTVGRRGIPYLDWGIHTGADWIRDQSYGGPYSPKKQVYKKSQEGQFTEVGNWTSGFTANGYRLIRFADVLLLLAECQIETGDLDGARSNINLIRARAANPDGFVKEADGVTNAANYAVNEYPLSGAPFDSKENALKALRFERKLELGMEGHRFFDLQRWGIVQNELNRIIMYEKTLRPFLYNFAVVGPQHVRYLIPQTEIDISKGKLQQNND